MSDDSAKNAAGKAISGEAWAEFCDMLKSAGQLIVDNSEASELERAEGFRYLARLTANALRQGSEPPPLTPPKIEYGKTRIGADNPDFMYGNCRVRGSAHYRITGQVNDAFNFNIGAFHGRLGSAEGLQGSGFLTRSDLSINAAGRFVIFASAQAPGEQGVDWLEMDPRTNSLIVRQTILRPGQDQPAELQIELVDGDLQDVGGALDGTGLEKILVGSGFMVHGIVQQFLRWTNDFIERPNTISEIKPELLGMAKGDPRCQYNYGYFQIEPEQALIVELKIPECEYWNIQLANHWMESLDSSQNASINCASVKDLQDNTARIVIAHQDPGCSNWLDTQQHCRGVIALRWLGAASKQADPELKLVSFQQLAAELQA